MWGKICRNSCWCCKLFLWVLPSHLYRDSKALSTQNGFCFFLGKFSTFILYFKDITALFLERISTYLKICSFSKSSSSCEQVTDLRWSEAEPRASFSKKYCLKIASKTLHWYQWEASQLKADEQKMSWGFWKAS